MRVLYALLSLTFLIATSAFAEGCAGAEMQIKTLTHSLGLNDAAAAQTLLMQLETSHADCPQLLLAKARIKALEEKAPEAAELFTQYIAQAPDDASGMAYYARFLIDQSEYQKADDLSSSALNLSADNPAALAVRGQILDMKRERTMGIALLRQSCALDPDNADAQFQLGSIFDRAKRPAEAAERFQKVVVLDVNYSPAWDYLALNLEKLGDAEKAENAFRKGLAVNHDGANFDAFLDYNYGRFLAKQNQLIESKRHLDRAVQLVPGYRATWYDRARVNLRLRNYAEARSDAEKAVSLTEQTGGILDLQVYTLLEQIYQHLGETELADKYAVLTRETPPPVRKGYEQITPQ